MNVIAHTDNNTHTHTEGSFTAGVCTIPAETESPFFQPVITCVCVCACLCLCLCVSMSAMWAKGQGAGTRMEMFGGCRGHEGWVDCWLMSHWSLLQSQLSRPNSPSNTRAGRSTGIWAYGWKSWVGRPHTVCICMDDSNTHSRSLTPIHTLSFYN